MKKTFVAFTLAALVCAAPATGLAEYYKYRDSNGIIRFTDNLAEVPPDQRGDAQRYEEFVTSPDEKKPVVTPAAKSAPKDRSGSANRTTASVNQLNARRQTLDSQYRGLLDEKRALETERARVKTRREVESYNRRVQTLNEKIAAYEKRRAAFEKQTEALNADTP